MGNQAQYQTMQILSMFHLMPLDSDVAETLPDGKLHSNNGDILFKRPVLQKIMFTLGF
jgi:hypothetical protein